MELAKINEGTSFWTNMVNFSTADQGEQRGIININIKEM